MPSSPNILFLMADQLTPRVLQPYGGSVCRTPHIERLGRDGVVFENAYCNHPICAPSRSAFVSGRLPSRIGSYDNASELPSTVPTFAHYLRDMGYHTCLAGKMHFIGADQLHGFEDRVTSDVYPADFSWTADWSLDAEAWLPYYHYSMRAVLDAGPWRRSVNTEYDEEVAVEAVRWL
jgi:choline-sulfatase